MYNSKNVDPAKQKENTFELYSVPIFPTNTPEIIKGEKIGSAKQSVENGDVLLCKINPKINRVWFVKNRTENTMIASSEWIVIRNKFMLTDYLVFCFMSPYFRDLMENNVSGVGGSLTRAQPSMVANYAIPIPPLQEQKRIIIEIKHWFELIDVIDQSKECLQGTIKKAKSKILDLAIHGKLVPQNPVDEPAADLLKRINPKAEITCDNGHYQKLPEGWILTRGKNIFNQMKSCHPFGEDFKYIDIDAIDNKQQKINKIKTIKVANAPSRASRYTQKGDVVFSMVRPYLRNIAMVPENNYIASTGFYVCSPKELLLTGFCYYLMVSDYVVNGLNQYMKGDNSPSINKKNVDDWFFPIPPLKEQHRIVAKIEEIFAQLNAIEASL